MQLCYPLVSGPYNSVSELSNDYVVIFLSLTMSLTLVTYAGKPNPLYFSLKYFFVCITVCMC